MRIPLPEELGVVRPSAGLATVDWEAVAKQLKELGAQGLQMGITPGSHRCTLLLTSDRPGVTWRVDATAATQDEAVRLALERGRQMRSATR
jgi:hypothetical protein